MQEDEIFEIGVRNMAEKKTMKQDAIPTFASDYVNHTPVEFSLTTLVNEDGAKRLAFSFIDHVLVPEVTTGDDGEQKHGARLERRYGSTVVLEEVLWDKMVALATMLKQQEQ